MKKTINLFSRVLAALVLCAGLVVTGCTEGPLDKNENTEQGGGENQGGSGNEDDEGEKPGQGGENQGGQGEPAEGEGDVVQTDVVTMTLDRVTATTATFTGHLNVPASDLSFSQITVYYSDSEPFNVNTAQSVSTTTFDDQQNFTITLQGLKYGTKYNYSLVAEVKAEKDYSDVADFITAGVVAHVSVVESSITATTASFSGTVTDLSEVDKSLIEVGVAYSSVSGDFQSNNNIKVASGEISEDWTFSMSASKLSYGTKYYYCTYVKQNGIYKYGEVKELTTVNVVPSVSVVESSITATTASFSGTVTGLSEVDKSLIEVGVAYSSVSGDFQSNDNIKVAIDPTSEDYAYSTSLENLPYGTKYYYCSYVKQNGIYKYGEVKELTTVNVVPSVSVVESSITETSASFSGTVTGLSEVDKSLIKVGMAYSSVSGDFQSNDNIKVASGEISEDWTFSISASKLYHSTKYYYCTYVKQNGIYKYGEVKAFVTIEPYVPAIKELNMSSATDLSSSESANCYIISQSGTYKFKTVKGNSSTSVGDVASCIILWESFGTSTTPDYCSLISAVCYKDNYIAFETSSTFTEGNAVIAAKDASGKILWSWHIWLTDQPEAQVYNNNAGTMMDRNLGATSATPGDVGALGLLYQWGRKDPFLGSSSISSNTLAKSTLSWPSAVKSSPLTGTIDYVIANPTTYVYSGLSNDGGWHYGSPDNTLWQSSKTIYDPCPSGWRVPDGGSSGVWSKALGSSSFFTDAELYDSTNRGMNFSGKFGSASTIWYPASGYRSYLDGRLVEVGYRGFYWSVTPFSSYAYNLFFNSNGYVRPLDDNDRVFVFAVRCLQVID